MDERLKELLFQEALALGTRAAEIVEEKKIKLRNSRVRNGCLFVPGDNGPWTVFLPYGIGQCDSPGSEIRIVDAPQNGWTEEQLMNMKESLEDFLLSHS